MKFDTHYFRAYSDPQVRKLVKIAYRYIFASGLQTAYFYLYSLTVTVWYNTHTFITSLLASYSL